MARNRRQRGNRQGPIGVLRGRSRRRNRGRRGRRLGTHETTTVRADASFLGIPPIPGTTYMESLKIWWVWALELASVIIGWILARQSDDDFTDRLFLRHPCYQDQAAKDADANSVTKKPLNAKTGVILVPLAIVSRVFLSVDNLLSQSAHITRTVESTPKEAPYPYGETDTTKGPAQFRVYHQVRHQRYRLISLNMRFQSDSLQSERQGRFHVGFTPSPVDWNDIQDYIRADDARMPAIPTVDAIKGSSFYKTFISGKGTSIFWRPTGYWAEWHELGKGIEVDSDMIREGIMVYLWDWSLGGFGSRPFGTLLLGYEVNSIDGVDEIPKMYDTKHTSMRISFTAVLQLSGTTRDTQHRMQGLGTAQGSLMRIIRGYYLTSMNQEALKVFRFSTNNILYLKRPHVS